MLCAKKLIPGIASWAGSASVDAGRSSFVLKVRSFMSA